ncbi:carbohydrate binding domain-containing protein [Curtobacterium sp. MCSS17_016]|uniref:carbohydrate binding domain-containing protein n=1 Tax=Curtobacterium sp. MCSS17_016 TaxID=2175644 RepID=UPI0015E8C900|nr:carbohydrate binding domain-containing protein [Curtobacterium sp. MCSS17_016]WIE81144.1 carbohydrate binding domain-containing protein [Curtobacterium sp. MCSS17_016]
MSLVLLVGGSFTVTAAITNAKNLTAKQDLDRIATAQTARAADGLPYADTVTDLTTSGSLTVAPGVGISNAGVHSGADCWTAFTRASTGIIWFRTSASPATKTVPTPWPVTAPTGWPAGCAWPTTVDDAIPVTVVNEIPNPALTTTFNGWSYHNDGTTFTTGRVATATPWGGSVYRAVATGSGYSALVGPYVSGRLTTGQFSLDEGETYTFSMWMKTNATTPLTVTPRVEWYAAGESARKANSTLTNGVTLEPGTWTRIVGTGTVPAGAPIPTATFYAEHSWVPGDTLDATAAMISRGDTVYDYADGTSSGWTWTGAANLSPSIGLGRTTGRIPGL